jgi:NAD(P)-dependent dehydrogenase (short-subunit alcohol dehydrogenase family)
MDETDRRLSAMSKQHVAFVTGAGRGIGEAIARRLGNEGVAVIVAARTASTCAAIASSIRASGGKAWPLTLDVGVKESIAPAVEKARKLALEFGPIDWLVNNAGIAHSAPFLAHGRNKEIDQYEEHMRVNFHGARWLIEALLPGMLDRKYGRIVNIASSAGIKSYAYAAAYGASKHALVGYSQAAAQELRKSPVTMNVVCPHYVDSPMTDESVALIVEKTGKTKAEVRKFLASQNPGGTLVTVDEVAQAVWDLLRGEGNGTIVELVGGKGVLPAEKTAVWR